MRVTALLAIVVQTPVAGSHISAAWTAPTALFKAASARAAGHQHCPVGSTVAFICRRANCIDPVNDHVDSADSDR